MQKPIDLKKIEENVQGILEAIGEDVQREGLQETPRRIALMYQEIFSGLNQDPKDYLEIFYEADHDELVIVKDIPLYSMCEHHFLPFIGKAHIAYIPKEGRVTGLSKLAKVVEVIASRPQLQERITKEVADTIMEVLHPYGVGVIIEAEHMCISMRGIKQPGTKTVTSAMRGIFRKDAASRSELLSLIYNK
ncbi:MAG: GTP cyclohydrolase I FolE [Clostridia bacterium]|jgi:GTP cyclohydrolase I|nr:GTP cyclohydrolase I FolE [Clostridia bacterium]